MYAARERQCSCGSDAQRVLVPGANPAHSGRALQHYATESKRAQAACATLTPARCAKTCQPSPAHHRDVVLRSFPCRVCAESRRIHVGTARCSRVSDGLAGYARPHTPGPTASRTPVWHKVCFVRWSRSIGTRASETRRASAAAHEAATRGAALFIGRDASSAMRTTGRPHSATCRQAQRTRVSMRDVWLTPSLSPCMLERVMQDAGVVERTCRTFVSAVYASVCQSSNDTLMYAYCYQRSRVCVKR